MNLKDWDKEDISKLYIYLSENLENIMVFEGDSIEVVDIGDISVTFPIKFYVLMVIYNHDSLDDFCDNNDMFDNIELDADKIRDIDIDDNTKECPRCNGEGILWNGGHDTTICRKCSGSGWIKD